MEWQLVLKIHWLIEQIFSECLLPAFVSYDSAGNIKMEKTILLLGDETDAREGG